MQRTTNADMGDYLQSAVQTAIDANGLDLQVAFQILSICFNKPQDEHVDRIMALLGASK